MAPQRKTRGAIQSDISLLAVKKREEIYITTKLLAWELVLLAIDSCRRLILRFEEAIMLLQWPWENQVFSWAIFFETSSTVSSVSMIESSWKSVEDPWYHQFILDIKNEIFTSNKEVNILAVFAQKKTQVHVFNDEEIMHKWITYIIDMLWFFTYTLGSTDAFTFQQASRTQARLVYPIRHWSLCWLITRIAISMFIANYSFPDTRYEDY